MNQLIELGIPDQDDLLRALGRLAIAHGNLEMVQIMCLKTLKYLEPQQALEEYRGKGAAKIRSEIKADILALARPEEEDRKQPILDLILDARCHSQRRNALLHRFWGQAKNGKWLTSGDESNWEGLPSVEVICDLTQNILTTTSKLNEQRSNSGFIKELASRRTHARSP